jgi:hypothetical protein
MQIPHENFAHVVNPENQTCLLLASHWISLKQIMATITQVEYRAKRQDHFLNNDCDPDPGMTRWLKYLNKQIDSEHQHYNQWPIWVEAQLDNDLTFFRNV